MISENVLINRSFHWFDVEEPCTGDFDALSVQFNLPHLLLQDTLRPEHLPKYEYSEEGHFLMLRSYDQNSQIDATTVQDLTRKIALFISTDRLLTIHRVRMDYLVKIKKNNTASTLSGLVHQIIINVIRSYELPLVGLQDMFDDFEVDVLKSKRTQLDTAKIYRFRRQIFVIKRILKQTQDALYRSKDFWEDSPSMLQDLKENIDQVYFQLDEISDNFEHLYQLHISMNDQRANEIMKVLTVFSSILLPLNFIASFYGMNFEHIPGLHSIEALIIVVIVMILTSVSAILFFKRKGWFVSREN